MKAVLEFNLPEEADEYSYATNGLRFRMAIDDILDYLRSQEKYLEADKRDQIPAVREKVYEILEENGVTV